MDAILRIILILILSQPLSSQLLDIDGSLMSIATDTDGSLETCSWLPRCYCKDESVYTNGSYLLLVNCTSAGLKSVPKNIPSNTTVLTLNENNITYLNSGEFAHLSRLLYLDLSKNGITSLRNDTFAGLSKLRTLELNGNKIRYNTQSIPDGVFADLKSLTRLNLQQNFKHDDVEPLEEYPTEALSNLRGLEELLIDGLQNKTFAKHIEKMRHLQSLQLNGYNGRCSVERISRDMFRFCRQITSLTLVNCKVESVQLLSFQILQNLTFLDLSYNPDIHINGLTNITFGLQTQQLRELRLIKIHQNTGECVALDKKHVEYMRNMNIGHLYLDSNRLATISTDAVSYLPRHIKGLSLKENMILAGGYLLEIFKQQIFSNLTFINLSEQNINDNFVNAFRNNTRNILALDQWGRSNLSTKSSETASLNETTSLEENARRCSNCPLIYYPFRFPETLLDIDASDMRVRMELKNLCVCQPNNIIRLNLERNIFWSWQGPFTGLGQVLNLNLAWNSCENMSRDVFHYMPKLLSLNLSKNFLETVFRNDLEGEIFKYQTSLVNLDISDNKIRCLPRNIFSGLKRLRKLIISDNFLLNFDADVDHMKGLSWLDISNNLLVSVATNTMDNLVKLSQDAELGLSVNLKNNKLSCSCNYIEFVHRFSKMTNHFIEPKSYTCKYESGDKQYLYQAAAIYERLQKECADYTTIIIASSLSLFAVLVVVGIFIIYRFRWKLRYLYYSAKVRHQGYRPVANNDDTEQFAYDVFISYSDTDRAVVKDVLVPELEEKRQVRVLVHDRDFIPGSFVVDNIVNAVTKSRKTMILMSRDFLRSKWCVREMNYARMEAIHTDRNVLLVVMLEPVTVRGLPLEIMDILRNQTYLELPEDQEHEELFWDRVKDLIMA